MLRWLAAAVLSPLATGAGVRWWVRNVEPRWFPPRPTPKIISTPDSIAVDGVVIELEQHADGVYRA